jgi:hypothetical protein
MKIPTTVKVLGETWRVKRVPGLIEKGYYGLASFKNRQIQLDKSLKGEELLQTFLHELGHAIFSEVGIHLTSVNHDIEEIIVDNFGKVLAKIIR